ncbi:hypothetical protein [Candidatus Frankia nodulisporulans]
MSSLSGGVQTKLGQDRGGEAPGAADLGGAEIDDLPGAAGPM